ncbi:hypothetical protein CPB83DRAFT_401501 [Crepidotus variabilis]|uniref:Uncharacterized protein n=1 Tax=Crepidotus variabilis TaxID=179855 RepID=A0A9P6EEJ4_9AGAR|nr:hypothetical protein CPB83DRAFT_401501 [Crepidotus variabilis]
MADPLSLTLTQFTGMFVQAILFGILLVTFGFCLHALFSYRGRWKRWNNINWLMVFFTTLTFGLAVFDICLNFYLNLKAFVLLQGQMDPADAFSNTSKWNSVTKSALVHIQALLGDSMLVYRCWIVWNRSFLPILVSLVLWLAATSITVWFIYLEVTMKNGLVISAKLLTPAITTFWAITITLNIITTALLVYCIWRVELNNKSLRSTYSRNRPSSLGKVIRYVIESGLLYTLFSIMTFITVVTGSNGPYIMGNADVMIVPIAFNLIIIRTSRIASHSESTTFAGSRVSGALAFNPMSLTKDNVTNVTIEEGVSVIVTRDTQIDSKFETQLA